MLSTAGACAYPPSEEPHKGVRPMWRQFETLPTMRSMAISGDPDGVWVGAAVGDEPSQRAADIAALTECRRRRTIARLQTRCRVYARGDEIVWNPFEKDPDPAEPDATD